MFPFKTLRSKIIVYLFKYKCLWYTWYTLVVVCLVVVMMIIWHVRDAHVQLQHSDLEFRYLKEKWKSLLVTEQFDSSNAVIRSYVQTLSKNAKYLYETLNADPKRIYLWPPEKGTTISADFSNQFDKLFRLALAYGTKGTIYYKSPEIISALKMGLDFLVRKKGYDGRKYCGNWWDWQIGVPQKFISILIITNDEIATEKIHEYTNVISGYVPNPFHQLYGKPHSPKIKYDLFFISNKIMTGSNRICLSMVVLGLGILQKNVTKIYQAMDGVTDVLKLTKSGDGFYEDGSFIQHGNVPFTGGYGASVVETISKMLYITKDSTYASSPELVQAIDIVNCAFLPLIYKGEIMPMVKGRKISSALSIKRGYIMQILISAAQFASEKNQVELKEAVKYWMKENPDYVSTANDYHTLLLTLSLLNDSSLAGDTLPFIGTKMYASMDRFVQRTSSYMIGLSMYSTRIAAFEAGNDENPQGWHTADGMLYLYNDDGVQFRNAYWATVDPYRLPGTTVDTVPLRDEKTYFQSFPSKEKWVGGVANAGQAVVGMALNKAGTKNGGVLLAMDLSGKKSWFIVDGAVVALGAGIAGHTTASIETVVDNRLLNDNYSYNVICDHGAIDETTETSKKNWLLLQSDIQNISIGYYFPKKETVDVVREKRSGKMSDDLYFGDYRKFIINHGGNPKDASYAYVMLPGISKAKLKKYSTSEPVKIIKNSPYIQAVEIKKADYLGVNIWSNTGGKVAGIRADKPVSLLRRSESRLRTYVLSDPTQSNSVIKLQIPEDFTEVVAMSHGITYRRSTNTFEVSFKNNAGNSKYITVGLTRPSKSVNVNEVSHHKKLKYELHRKDKSLARVEKTVIC